MKKCVIRIAAIDLRKGSKITSFFKTSRSPAFNRWAGYNHLFDTNPFLRPFQRLESYVPNVSLAVRTPDVTCSKFFVSRSNGWHYPFARLVSSVRNFFARRLNGWRHPFEIFPVPFQRLTSSVRNFSSAVRTFTASARNFSVAVRTVFETVLNGWKNLFSAVGLTV